MQIPKSLCVCVLPLAKSPKSPREDRWTTGWSLWRWLTTATLTCRHLPTPTPSSIAAYLRTFTDYVSPFFYDISEPQTEPLFIISPGLFPFPCFLRFESSTFTGAFHELVSSYGRSAFVFFRCPLTRTRLWGKESCRRSGRLWNEAYLLRKHKDNCFFLRLRCLDSSYNWSHNVLSLHFFSIVAWESRLVLCFFYRPASATYANPGLFLFPPLPIQVLFCTILVQHDYLDPCHRKLPLSITKRCTVLC